MLHFHCHHCNNFYTVLLCLYFVHSIDPCTREKLYEVLIGGPGLLIASDISVHSLTAISYPSSVKPYYLEQLQTFLSSQHYIPTTTTGSLITAH